MQAHDTATFPAEGTAVSAAREFVRRAVVRWQLTDIVDDAVLLTSELVTNAVIHTGTETEVTVDRLGDTVEVSVLDRYADRVLPQTPTLPEAGSEGGRGLYLLRTLAPHWGVEHRPDGKRVWFRLTSVAPPLPRPTVPVEPSRSEAVLLTVVTVDPDGVVTDWHGDAARVYGWSATDVKGRALDDLIGDTAVEVLEGCRRNGRWRGRVTVRHRDGGAVPSFASHIAVAGETTRISGVWVEEPLRTLLDAPVALVPAPGNASLETAAGAAPRRRSLDWIQLDDDAAANMPFDEFLLRVTESARAGVDGDAAYVAVLDEDEGTLEVRAEVGLAPGHRRVTVPPGEGAMGRVDFMRLPRLVDELDDTTAGPVLAGQGFRSLVSCPLSSHGRVVGRLVVASRRAGAFSRDSATRLQMLGDRAALALESARLADLERRRRGNLAFMAEASDLLAGTLQPEMAVAMLGQIVVPRLSDWCAVWLDEPAEPYVWHTDENRIDTLRRLLSTAPVEAAGTDTPVTVATRLPPLRLTGSLQTGDVRSRAVLEELGVQSRLLVPLRARNRGIGRLVVGRGRERPFRADEIALLEDIARRAALAFDNALLFTERSRVAHALQASLLPPDVPDLPAAQVGVAYRAAGEGLDVGGDFYDVWPLGNGRYGFAVGDVCGKGADAAAVTGLARHTLRLLSGDDRPLPAVLRRLNDAILQEGPRARFVTLLYGEVRATGDGLAATFCCAGHPPPLLLTPTGTVRAVGTPQTLLGVFDDIVLTPETLTIPRGDALVCYTDGVTERRSGSRMLGEDGLMEALRRCGGLDAAAVAARVQQVVTDFASEPPRDDLAVLVLRAT